MGFANQPSLNCGKDEEAQEIKYLKDKYFQKPILEDAFHGRNFGNSSPASLF